MELNQLTGVGWWQLPTKCGKYLKVKVSKSTAHRGGAHGQRY